MALTSGSACVARLFHSLIQLLTAPEPKNPSASASGGDAVVGAGNEDAFLSSTAAERLMARAERGQLTEVRAPQNTHSSKPTAASRSVHAW